MKVITAKVCPDPDSEQFALFIHGRDEQGRDRFLMGGVDGSEWVYQEFPTPNAENTRWIGGQADSPHYVPPR